MIVLKSAIGMFVDDCLSYWATKDPDKTLIRTGKQDISASALNKRINGTVAELKQRGVGKGVHVGTLLDNSAEMVVASLAVLRSGAVLVPINTRYHRAIVNHILTDASIRLLIAKRGGVAGIVCDTILDAESVSQPGNTSLPCTDRTPDALAVLFYTSGSTGRPKGVMVSHSGLMYGIDSVRSYLPIQPTDRLGAVLPMSFDAGFNFVMSGLNAGSSVDLLSYVFPRSFADEIHDRCITGMVAVPQVFRALSACNSQSLPNMRFCAATGGRMDPDVIDSLSKLMPDMRFWVMYGLTEAFRATALEPEDFPRRRASIGKAIPHAFVKIVRPDGSEASVGEVGEIAQTGPLMGLGYWNNTSATAERYKTLPLAFGSAPFPYAVLSGDLGWRDAEGFLYFTGRKDRMIKSRGFRIAPEEIEKALVDHAGAGAAYVVGIDDKSHGQRIVAFLESGKRPLGSDAEILAAIRTHLSSFMLPDEFRRVEAFPLSANGKINGEALRDTL